MKNAQLSVRVFGIYMSLLGLVLVFTPGTALEPMGFPGEKGMWVRMFGMLLFLLSVYYWIAARVDLEEFYKWTVPCRLSVPGFYAAFFFMDLAPGLLVALGAVDVGGAAWTWWALRPAGAASVGD